MMNENSTEKKVDKSISEFRETHNKALLEIAKLIKAALVANNHSEKRLSEIEVLRKMVKEREKAIEIYKQAGREDLLNKEVQEKDYISTFLPSEPSEHQLTLFIKAYTLNRENVPMKEVIDTTIANFPTAQKSTIAKLYKSLLV